VTANASTQIASWGLSRESSISVWSRLLFDLAADPDGLLVMGGVPPPSRLFAFVLTDGDDVLRFYFVVNREDAAESLWVVGAWIERGGAAE
jgi:hypothetical protein